MATYNHASQLVRRIPYPTVLRRGLAVAPRSAPLPMATKEQVPVRSSLEGKEISDIFYQFESRPLNPWAALGSLGLLSVFLLALIAIPLFHIDPLPKKKTLTMLYLPPPPAAGAIAMKFEAPRKVPSTHSPKIAIPAPVHIAPEAVPMPGEAIGSVPGGVVGGIAGGVLSDVLGGSRSMPLPAKTPEPAPVRRIRVASRVAEANLIHEVPPQYPPDAGRDRIEGTVVLLAVIGSDGSVEDVQVVSGLPILAQAAIEAVKQWRYKPYELNGVPVEIDSRITINFTLSRG